MLLIIEHAVLLLLRRLSRRARVGAHPRRGGDGEAQRASRAGGSGGAGGAQLVRTPAELVEQKARNLQHWHCSNQQPTRRRAGGKDGARAQVCGLP
jgi:hypothetical protein